MDARMQIDLVQSLGNLKKMQHLTVVDEMDRKSDWDAAVPSRDLRCLFLGHIRFRQLPSWISSAHLPCLSHFDLHVKYVYEQRLKALGGLPELCYLRLMSEVESLGVIETDGYFQKLRALVLPNSLFQFVANEDSCASFTVVSSGHYRGLASGKDRKKDNGRVVIMPSLEELQFGIIVNYLVKQNKDFSCGDLGLEYLPLVRRVNVDLTCYGAFEEEALVISTAPDQSC